MLLCIKIKVRYLTNKGIDMDKITVNELAEKWFSEKLPTIVKTSTMTTYLSCYRRFLEPYFGDTQVADVTNAQLIAFFETAINNKALNRAATLSPQTITVVHNVCFNIFAYAKELNLINTNPYYDIKKPARRSSEKRVLTRKEQYRLERACRYFLDYRVIGILLSLYTGMRIGEICSLQWSDIDFKRHVIYVSKTVSRVTNFEGSGVDHNVECREQKTVVQIRTPKTQSSCRLIPVPKFLMDRLITLRKINPHPYVVNNKNDNPMCTRMMTYIFKRMVKLAEIDDANFHCLRHTFATRALESGMDIKTVSEVLGHSNHAITVNVYVHSLIDHKRNMMCKIQPLLDEKEPDYNMVTEEDIMSRIR